MGFRIIFCIFAESIYMVKLDDIINVKIQSKLYNEIKEYCELNELDIDKYVNDKIREGLMLEKYGNTPFLTYNAPKEEEKEKTYELNGKEYTIEELKLLARSNLTPVTMITPPSDTKSDTIETKSDTKSNTNEEKSNTNEVFNKIEQAPKVEQVKKPTKRRLK